MKQLLNKIPCDKRMHLLIGVILVSVLTIFTLNLYVMFLSLLVVAWGIEFYQKFTKSGMYDNFDAIAVVIGGLIVLASHIIYIK